MTFSIPNAQAPLSLSRAGWLLAAAITLLTVWRLWTITHSGITLFVDEAYYWGWSQELAWGYFSKPPVVAAIIAATTGLFGHGLAGVKAGSLVLYPVTACLLFGLGRQLYGARVGLLAALAFLTLPITALLGLAISTDAPLLCCWTAALWLLHNALTHQRLKYWLLLGLVCGLGVLSKYTMAAFALSALVLLLGTNHGRRQLSYPGPWLAALTALVVMAPNLWWNWQNDFPTLRHTAEITHVGERVANTKGTNLLEFVAAQIGSLGPFLFAGLVGAIWHLKAAWRLPSDRLLLAGSLPLLLLVVGQAAAGRANANWAGPAFTAGTLLAVAWLCRSRWGQKLLVAGFIVNCSLMALLYHWPSVVALSGHTLTAKLDPFKRMKGWDTIAAQLAPIVQSHPQAYVAGDGRTFLAHSAYNLRDLPLRVAAWNPDGSHRDQYQITHSLPNQPGLDLIYLGAQPPAEMLERFAHSEHLTQVHAQTHPDFALHLDVWLLQNFKGYR